LARPLVIGITGILGSGKTTVLSSFEKEGCGVISADEIVHLLLKQPEIVSRIAIRLGKRFLTATGRINRRKLAADVFANPSRRVRLERILHPAVFRTMEKRILDAAGRYAIIALEVPLLFETKSESRFDKIVVVSATPEIIRRRVKPRIPEQNLTQRWNAQLSQDVKIRRADFVIDNSFSRTNTRAQVHAVITRLKHKVSRGSD